VARLVFLLLFVVLVLFSKTARAEDWPRVDRTTPRRAMAAFLEAADAADYTRAAESLDLRRLPASERRTQGPELARELHVVLDRAAWVELADLSDDPGGVAKDGKDTETVTVARVDGRDLPITLARITPANPQSDAEWMVSASTVGRIPKLYEEHGPGPIEQRMPDALRHPRIGGLAAWQWLGLPIVTVIAALLGIIVAWIVRGLGGRLAAATRAQWDDELAATTRGPTRLFVAALAVRLLLPFLAPSAAAMHVLSRMVAIGTIWAVAWIAMRVVVVFAHLVERRAKAAALAAADAELQARGVATQVRVLRRVVNVAIGIVAVALGLLQFEVVRNVGVSLLASAGIAGIVLGLAAQRTIASLIAGIQMSATQPIRIGDAVVIEKEWGTIEEVTLTYVVVRIWDERRLIVPMTRFLEQPFENWTKTSADIHGTVFVTVDWKLPIAELRKEVDRIVESHSAWDKRTKTVVVAEARDRAIEVRVLVSAKNADDLAKLRFETRERIVDWLQKYEDGKYLPFSRVEERHVS
jgi:small-conductance mechanosensitive channel